MKTKLNLVLVMVLGIGMFYPIQTVYSGEAPPKIERSAQEFVERAQLDNGVRDLQFLVDVFRGDDSPSYFSNWDEYSENYHGAYKDLYKAYQKLRSDNSKKNYEAYIAQQTRATEAAKHIYLKSLQVQHGIESFNAKVGNGYHSAYKTWEQLLSDRVVHDVNADGTPRIRLIRAEGEGEGDEEMIFESDIKDAWIASSRKSAPSDQPAAASHSVAGMPSDALLMKYLMGESVDPASADKSKKSEVSQACENCEPSGWEKFAAYGMTGIGLAASIVAGVHKYKFANKLVDVGEGLYKNAMASGDSPMFALSLLRDAYHPANNPFANIGDMLAPPMYAIQALFNGRRNGGNLSGDEFQKHMDKKAKEKRMAMLWQMVQNSGRSERKTEATRRTQETVEFTRHIQGLSNGINGLLPQMRKNLDEFRKTLPAMLQEATGFGEMNIGETVRALQESASALGVIADFQNKMSMLADNIGASLDQMTEGTDNLDRRVNNGQLREIYTRERNEDVRSQSRGPARGSFGLGGRP